MRGLSSILLAFGAIATAAAFERAPDRSDFLSWQSNVVGRAATAADASRTGFVPPPCRFAAPSARRLLRGVPRLLATAGDGDAAPPARFDAREKEWITSVKNQNPYGACWAFSALGALEAVQLKATGVTHDFSENNLANLHGFDAAFNDGGNFHMSSAYLLRWAGPVRESDDPYPSIGTSTNIPPVLHVQDVRCLAERSDCTDNDDIKRAVMEYGSVQAAFRWASTSFNAATAGYCYTGQGSVNHAVLIVGWDDAYAATNFATTASVDGAFIVKNSWGASWGTNGYFYISYADTSLGAYGFFAYPPLENADNYARVYQHDPLGYVTSYGYRSETCWAANVFTASRIEELSAVGLWAIGDDTACTLALYTNVAAAASSPDPRQGEKAFETNLVFSQAGYYTVPLPTGLRVTGGTSFSAVMRLNVPGSNYPAPAEMPYTGYSSQATAAAGESFLAADGDTLAWEDLGAEAGANVCCKVYARDIPGETALPPVITSYEPTGDVILPVGYAEAFAVSAYSPDGDACTYVWTLDGEPIADATTFLCIFSAKRAHYGTHTLSCVVSTAGGVARRDWRVSVPRTVYVDAYSTAAEPDGDTPETAYRDLTAVAAAAVDGDTIRVAPGIYTPAYVTASNVLIQATAGCEETVIDGGNTDVCVAVSLSSASASAQVEGFTLWRGAGVVAFNGWGWATYGGGAFGVTLADCRVIACQAQYGGGAYGCFLVDSVLFANEAQDGGAASASTLCGCTLAANQAAAYSGGIDYRSDAYNSIFWQNTLTDGSTADFECDGSYASSLAYCSTTAALAAGDGNRTGDPKFVDASGGDFRLRVTSPCADAGSTNYVLTATDILGDARVQGAAPNLGPYETTVALPLALSDTNLYVSAAAQTNAIVLQSDALWMAASSADWLAVTPATDTGDGALALSFSENATASPRTASIYVIEFTGSGRQAVTVTQTAPSPKPDASSRYFALVDGIGTYGFGEIASLPGAVNDALSIYARCTDWGFVSTGDILLLTNACATCAAVRAALTNLAARAVAGDTVLFYQSGHGRLDAATRMALVQYDGYYWDDDLAADLALFAAGVRVVVMADTCYSGGLFQSGSGALARALPPSAAVWAERVRLRADAAADIGWITASDYDEYAYESGSQGLFTAACVAGWRGAADADADGLVTFYDLWHYARNVASELGTTAQCANETLLMATHAGFTESYTNTQTATWSTPVTVPYAWLDAYMAGLGYATGASGVYAPADYERAASSVKTDSSGQTVTAWQDYVAGTDPTDSNAVFTASIVISNGLPCVTWSPDLNADGESRRNYRILGREDLATGAWGPTNDLTRFYKVDVSLIGE